MTLSCLTSQLGQFCSLVADSRSNSAPVEPLSTLHDLIKVEIRRISLCDSAVSTVVDNLRWAHRSTCLCIVETYSITTAGDKLSIDAITTKTIYCNLANLVLWQL